MSKVEMPIKEMTTNNKNTNKTSIFKSSSNKSNKIAGVVISNLPKETKSVQSFGEVLKIKSTEVSKENINQIEKKISDKVEKQELKQKNEIETNISPENSPKSINQVSSKDVAIKERTVVSTETVKKTVGEEKKILENKSENIRYNSASENLHNKNTQNIFDGKNEIINKIKSENISSNEKNLMGDSVIFDGKIEIKENIKKEAKNLKIDKEMHDQENLIANLKQQIIPEDFQLRDETVNVNSDKKVESSKNGIIKKIEIVGTKQEDIELLQKGNKIDKSAVEKNIKTDLNSVENVKEDVKTNQAYGVSNLAVKENTKLQSESNNAYNKSSKTVEKKTLNNIENSPKEMNSNFKSEKSIENTKLQSESNNVYNKSSKTVEKKTLNNIENSPKEINSNFRSEKNIEDKKEEVNIPNTTNKMATKKENVTNLKEVLPKTEKITQNIQVEKEINTEKKIETNIGKLNNVIKKVNVNEETKKTMPESIEINNQAEKIDAKNSQPRDNKLLEIKVTEKKELKKDINSEKKIETNKDDLNNIKKKVSVNEETKKIISESIKIENQDGKIDAKSLEPRENKSIEVKAMEKNETEKEEIFNKTKATNDNSSTEKKEVIVEAKFEGRNHLRTIKRIDSNEEKEPLNKDMLKNINNEKINLLPKNEVAGEIVKNKSIKSDVLSKVEIGNNTDKTKLSVVDKKSEADVDPKQDIQNNTKQIEENKDDSEPRLNVQIDSGEFVKDTINFDLKLNGKKDNPSQENVKINDIKGDKQETLPSDAGRKIVNEMLKENKSELIRNTDDKENKSDEKRENTKVQKNNAVEIRKEITNVDNLKSVNLNESKRQEMYDKFSKNIVNISSAENRINDTILVKTEEKKETVKTENKKVETKTENKLFSTNTKVLDGINIQGPNLLGDKKEAEIVSKNNDFKAKEDNLIVNNNIKTIERKESVIESSKEKTLEKIQTTKIEEQIENRRQDKTKVVKSDLVEKETIFFPKEEKKSVENTFLKHSEPNFEINKMSDKVENPRNDEIKMSGIVHSENKEVVSAEFTLNRDLNFNSIQREKVVGETINQNQMETKTETQKSEIEAKNDGGMTKEISDEFGSVKKYGLKNLKTEENKNYSELSQISNHKELQANISTVVKTENKPVTDYFSVLDQIDNGIKMNFNSTTKEMRIKLNPEELGELEIKINVENGIMKAEFNVENQRVKEIIESRFNELKQSLTDQGIDAQTLSVNISSGSNSGYKGQNEKEKFSFDKKNKINSTESAKKSENIIKSNGGYGYISRTGVNITA